MDLGRLPQFYLFSCFKCFVNSRAARVRALGIGKCPLCPAKKGFLWGQNVLSAKRGGSSKQVLCIQDGLSLILKCVIVFRVNYGNKNNHKLLIRQ